MRRLEGIVGTLTVQGNAGQDILSVDDGGETADGQAGRLTATALTGFGLGSSVIYGTLEEFNLDLGTGADQLVIENTHGEADIVKTTNINTGDGADPIPNDDNVRIIAIGGPTNVNTGTGKDLVIVGSKSDLTGADANDSTLDGLLHGLLFIDGGDDSGLSLDEVQINNRGDDGGTATGGDGQQSGTLTPTGLIGFGIGEGAGIEVARFETQQVFFGSANDTLFVDGTQEGNVLIDLGEGSDVINISAISGRTEVFGGTGSDIFNVNFDEDGGQTFENGIFKELFLNGQDGSDTSNVGLAGIGSSRINVTDTGDPASGIDQLQVLGTNQGDYFLLRANLAHTLGMVAAIEVDEDRNPRQG